tara:strand:- start:1458 stop:1823 length:366 start_codon:yes stop_codon:yes gene_type:complete
MNTRNKIKAKCKALQDLLLSKNARYGDASLEPLNVFSKANAVTSIKCRIDDKLKRVMNAGVIEDTEDTLQDLAGYLILLMIAKDNASNDIQKRIRQEEPSSHTTADSTATYSGREVEYFSD